MLLLSYNEEPIIKLFEEGRFEIVEGFGRGLTPISVLNFFDAYLPP